MGVVLRGQGAGVLVATTWMMSSLLLSYCFVYWIRAFRIQRVCTATWGLDALSCKMLYSTGYQDAYTRHCNMSLPACLYGVGRGLTRLL